MPFNLRCTPQQQKQELSTIRAVLTIDTLPNSSSTNCGTINTIGRIICLWCIDVGLLICTPLVVVAVVLFLILWLRVLSKHLRCGQARRGSDIVIAWPCRPVEAWAAISANVRLVSTPSSASPAIPSISPASPRIPVLAQHHQLEKIRIISQNMLECNNPDAFYVSKRG